MIFFAILLGKRNAPDCQVDLETKAFDTQSVLPILCNTVQTMDFAASANPFPATDITLRTLAQPLRLLHSCVLISWQSPNRSAQLLPPGHSSLCQPSVLTVHNAVIGGGKWNHDYPRKCKAFRQLKQRLWLDLQQMSQAGRHLNRDAKGKGGMADSAPRGSACLSKDLYHRF